MEPKDVHDLIGIFAWSQKFLRGFVKALRNVPDRQAALHLLEKSREQRKDSKKRTVDPKTWVVADVRTLVDPLPDQGSALKSKSRQRCIETGNHKASIHCSRPSMRENPGLRHSSVKVYNLKAVWLLLCSKSSTQAPLVRIVIPEHLL